MRATVLWLALAGCNFPEPARVPDDFTGTISVGGGVIQNETIAVVDDGLEAAEPACANEICTTGGISP